MSNKTRSIGLIAVACLGLAYVGGSYYVGAQASDRIRAMLEQSQAQSDQQLVWKDIRIDSGLFTSTGQMIMALPEVTLKNDPSDIAQMQVDYSIDHALGFDSMARFQWSVTPQTGLAKALDEVYQSTPSLTGQGEIDWQSKGTTTIAFPGLDNADIDGETLTLSPLDGTLVVGDNEFDLALNLPVIDIDYKKDGQKLEIKGLGYEAKSTDTRKGAGSIAIFLDQAQMFEAFEGQKPKPMAHVSDYRWQFDIQYQNNILDLQTRQTAKNLKGMGSDIDNVDIAFGFGGLHRADIAEFGELLNQVDGDVTDMSAQQFEQAENLLLGVLARGVTFSIPALKGDWKLAGQSKAQTVGLEGLSFSAQLLDTATSAGQMSLELKSLAVPEMFQSWVPAVEGLKLTVKNAVNDGRSDIGIEHELAHFSQRGRGVRDVKFDMSLKGFTPAQLTAIADIFQAVDGNFDRLSEQQQAQLRNILEAAAKHGVQWMVPVAQMTIEPSAGKKDSFELKGFDVQVKLDDAATGAGQARLSLGQLKSEGPQMAMVPAVEQFLLTADNKVVDGKIDYDLQVSLQSLEDAVVKLGASSLSLKLTGLSAGDMQRLSELVQSMEQGLNKQEEAELAQILRQALAQGFELSMPTFEAKVHDASLNGSAAVTLQGLGSAPLSSFDVARLAQLQADLEVTGKSPMLDGFVAQGQAMGLLAKKDQSTIGKYVFKDGKFVMNGAPVPVTQYVQMVNAMVLGALGTAGATQPASPETSSNTASPQKPKRAP